MFFFFFFFFLRSSKFERWPFGGKWDYFIGFEGKTGFLLDFEIFWEKIAELQECIECKSVQKRLRQIWRKIMSRMQTLSLVRVVTRNIGSRADFSGNFQSLCRCRAAAISPASEKTRNFSTSPINHVFANSIAEEEGFIRRNLGKMKFWLSTKYKLRPYAWLLYRDTMDRIDYLGFFKEFRMPDTFFAWFLVTELHVWMLMVRLMAEGREGTEMRKYIVEAMWQDTDVRKKQLGNVRESVVRGHIEEMGHQFNAAIMGYDEGLLTNDRILAGAIWRRFLQCECNNPEQVEKLVAYIRKTMIMLDKIPFHTFTKGREIHWLDYKKL